MVLEGAKPTTRQSVVEEHSTESSDPSCGVLRSLHDVPSHESTRAVPCAPRPPPTAKHWDGDVQVTALSCGKYPDTDGVDVALHLNPSQWMTRGALLFPDIVDPTPQQSLRDGQASPWMASAALPVFGGGEGIMVHEVPFQCSMRLPLTPLGSDVPEKPAAQQSLVVGHVTAASIPPAGLLADGTTRHAFPFQCSISVGLPSPAPPPTAQQFEGVRQVIAARESPDGMGSGTVVMVQTVPFHRSTSAFEPVAVLALDEPTAKQSEADGHAMEDSTLS
jgi:hypothetical protein